MASLFFAWFYGDRAADLDWKTRISRYVETTPGETVETVLGELRRIESRVLVNAKAMPQPDALGADDQGGEFSYREWISSLANTMEIELVMRLTAHACQTTGSR